MNPLSLKRLFQIATIPALFGAGALAAGWWHGGNPPDGRNSVAAAPVAVASTLPSKPYDVAIDNFSFSPPTLTIASGATVTWVNHDDVPHTVTANDKSFDSKAMDTDDRFTRVFATPGTYAYFCAVHPHMTGRIVVK